MTFQQRTNFSSRLIDYLNKYYWNRNIIKNNYKMLQIPYGYENYFTEEHQEKMKHRYTNTTKFIRYSPDFFIMQENSDRDCFLEYKVTKTPRYTFKNSQWNYGQIEADALENYLKLAELQVNVAVVIYCPYHSRPLLCGIPSLEWIVGNRQRTPNSIGSRTDFYNINLLKIPSFSKFMETFFNIPVQESKNLLNQEFFNLLKNDDTLQTEHAPRSVYNTEKHKTGFNWRIDDFYYNS